MLKLRKAIVGCWYFFWGHIFGWMFYDKKFLKGRWFSGKLHGLCSTGWRWVTLDGWARIWQRQNLEAKFPVNCQNRIVCPENITFDIDDLNNFQSFGIYYQAIGKISMGGGTFIGPNVGIITSNHDVADLDRHLEPKEVIIGKKCWIGMNSVILPGVNLGDNTIVGAGSVVTKSFPEGHCVIAGNPAKKIKDIKE